MRVLHVFLLMLLPAFVSGQSFPFTKFTVSDGLPHSNVFAITEDTSGYLWLGTESGLVRFDGSAFVSFYSEAPLSRGLVTALQFSEKGKLYAGTHDNKVFRIDGTTVTNLRAGSGPVLAVNSIAIQKEHVFVFHEFTHSNVISEQEHERSAITFDQEAAPFCSRMISDGSVITGKRNGLFRIRDGIETAWKPEGFADDTVYSVFEDGEDIFLGCSGTILQVRGNKVISRFPVPAGSGRFIKMLVRDRYHNFWFGFFGDENFYVMTPEGRVYNLFETSGVSKGIVGSVHRDSNGSIWISILGQGLYRFSASLLHNTVPNIGGQQITITCADLVSERYLIFGTHNGLLFYDKMRQSVLPFKLDDKLLEFVRDIEVYDNKIFVCITDIRLKEIPVKEKLFISETDTFRIVYRHASSIAVEREGILLGNWDNKILKEKTGGADEPPLHIDKRFSQRVNCLETDGAGNLYAGTPTGLIVFNNARSSKQLFKHPVLESSVNRMALLPDGELMIVTDNGVAVMREMRVIRTYEKIGRNRITAIAETGNGMVYAATTNGLYRISGSDTVRIGTEQGLPAGHINQLLTDITRNELIIITANSFSRVPLTALQQYRAAAPGVLISAAQTSGGTIHFRGPVVIPYDEKLKLLTFSSLGSLENGQVISLTADGEQEHFIFNSTFDLSELTPGEHQLSVAFVNDDGTKGKPTLVTVELTPPFYRTSLFYMITGISGAGMALAGWRRRKRTSERKKLEQEQLDYKMNLLKQQALVSNLNPHFIFNALNAIQAFINSEQQGKANEYLALFARLMRQQLNTAGKDLIPLSEELERLKNYLEIESLRFGDKLEYHIETDERFGIHEPSIPNMIIQPFLENAIWHGFKGMKERGCIRLSIFLSDTDELLIRIEDNGKGMDDSFMKKHPGKDPRGISLIRERLELMDEKGRQPLTFAELDPGAIMPGTVVTIRLSPKMYRIIT